MAQALGIIDLEWRGRNLAVEKGAKIKPGGLQNNPVTYGRRTARASEFVPSEVMGTIPFERGMQWDDFWTEQEGELKVICDTGQTFVIADAFLVDMPDMTGGEGGKVELKWNGGKAQQV